MKIRAATGWEEREPPSRQRGSRSRTATHQRCRRAPQPRRRLRAGPHRQARPQRGLRRQAGRLHAPTDRRLRARLLPSPCVQLRTAPARALRAEYLLALRARARRQQARSWRVHRRSQRCPLRQPRQLCQHHSTPRNDRRFPSRCKCNRAVARHDQQLATLGYSARNSQGPMVSNPGSTITLDLILRAAMATALSCPGALLSALSRSCAPVIRRAGARRARAA